VVFVGEGGERGKWKTVKVNANAGTEGFKVMIELGFEVEGHYHGHGWLSSTSFASELKLTIFTMVRIHVVVN